MKKFSFWALLIMLAIPLIQSCKEDLNLQQEEQATVNNLAARGVAPDAISTATYIDRFGNKQMILKFATKQVFKDARIALENKYDANTDLENEYEELTAFNQQYQFSSLLGDYIQAENEWLMTEDLPDATDPDNNFYNLDPEDLVFLNHDRAVMVEGQILVFFKDGFVQITNGDFSIIEKVLQYDMASDLELLGGQQARVPWWAVIILWLGDGWEIEQNTPNDVPDGCHIHNRFHENIRQGNRRYKCKGRYHFRNAAFFVQPKIRLRMKSYKKRRFFGWKKVKANMKLKLVGHHGEGSCNLNQFKNDPFSDYTKNLTHKWTAKKNYYTQDNQLHAEYYVDNNLIYFRDLYDD